MTKVLVVGAAGGSGLAVAVALALADAACKVEVVAEVGLHAKPLADPAVLGWVTPSRAREARWYQQFAGKHGKSPRY